MPKKSRAVLSTPRSTADVIAFPVQRLHLGNLSAERLRALGFREHPFVLGSDPRFLFPTRQHTQVLERVQDVINYREGLAVVEGPVGAGKTTVARRLYDLYAFDERHKVAYIPTAIYSSPVAATRDISAVFGQENRRAYLDQIRQFETFLVKQRSEERNVVIIIDDAQRMRPEALQALHDIFNFDARVKLAQVIVFGQPQIHKIFAGYEPILDRIAAWQKLSPLPADDALAMIRFRCSVAGRSENESLLEDTAFLRLYEFAGGLPRPMIIACGELLHILARKEKRTAGVEDVSEAITTYEARPHKDKDD